MKAVVALESNRLDVIDVRIDPPGVGEVKIKMAAVGICHSDLSVLNGTVPMPLPMVLGHEGAGIVAEVGPEVTNVAPGDHVILSFVPACGRCFFCLRKEPHFCTAISISGRMLDGTARLHFGDQDLGAMSQLGCMAEYAIVPAISVVAVDNGFPLELAALIGCGVMTGVGAVINTAEVKAGSTVAVFGCGGVGLSAVQGARLAGAKQVIAIDVAEQKLELAKRVGATHIVTGGKDASEAVCKLTTEGWGVDYSFDFTGMPVVMAQAYRVARRGGTICIGGIGHYSESFLLNAGLFAPEGKKIIGCFYGSANYRIDMPNMLALAQNHQLDLESLITRTYSIDQAKQAFADLEAGRNIRGVILFN